MSYETRQRKKTGQQTLGFVRSDKPPVSLKPRGNVKVTNEAEKLDADPLVSPTSEKMEDERPKCSCETSTKVIESKIDQQLDRFIQVEETIGKKISALDGRVNCVESNLSSLHSEVQRLSGEIERISHEAGNARIEIEALKSTNTMQARLIEVLENKLDDVQGRTRRKTLIFRGVPEGEEGGTTWQHCKMFIAELLSSHFDLDDADIERAHRSPTVRDSSRSSPRPIMVAFLRWEQANKVLQTAGRVLKNKPYKDLNGNEINIYVEQFYSPKFTELRSKALKIRRQVKDEHPDWIVLMRYPAKLFIKKAPDDLPTEYKRAKDYPGPV